jgi:hypothetical protein
MTTASGDPSALFERLIRIETKLDVSNANAADHEGRLRALELTTPTGGHQDHEIRIRRVERSVWLIAGAAAAGGGIVGQLIAPLLNK